MYYFQVTVQMCLIYLMNTEVISFVTIYMLLRLIFFCRTETSLTIEILHTMRMNPGNFFGVCVKSSNRKILLILCRSKFKFYVITFGSSFFNASFGYYRFAIEGRTPILKRFLSKMSLALMMLIISSLGIFIFFMILIQTNVDTHIIFRTFCGNQFQRCEEFFIHHFKTSFNFITLVYPPSFLLLNYVPTLIFLVKRTLNKWVFQIL